MAFLILLGLTTILGVRSEFNCEEGKPQCMNERIFSESSVCAHRESGGILNNVRCLRVYDEECEDLNISADSAAMLTYVTEFCDENSDLRKGYVANVDCFNSLKISNHTCYHSTMRTTVDLYSEYDEIMREKGIINYCLQLHLFRPCAVEAVKESCGEYAGQTATDFLDRLDEMYKCSEERKGLIEGLLADLLSNANERD